MVVILIVIATPLQVQHIKVNIALVLRLSEEFFQAYMYIQLVIQTLCLTTINKHVDAKAILTEISVNYLILLRHPLTQGPRPHCSPEIIS